MIFIQYHFVAVVLARTRSEYRSFCVFLNVTVCRSVSGIRRYRAPRNFVNPSSTAPATRLWGPQTTDMLEGRTL